MYCTSGLMPGSCIKKILVTDVHVCKEISVNLVLNISLGLVARKSQNEIKSLG